MKGPGGGESLFVTEPIPKTWDVHGGGGGESQVRLRGQQGAVPVARCLGTAEALIRSGCRGGSRERRGGSGPPIGDLATDRM